MSVNSHWKLRLITRGHRITECVNVRPTLASVRQDVSYRARKAVEYLTCMKKDNDCSVTEKISVEFIPRDSCIQQPELSTVRNR